MTEDTNSLYQGSTQKTRSDKHRSGQAEFSHKREAGSGQDSQQTIDVVKQLARSMPNITVHLYRVLQPNYCTGPEQWGRVPYSSQGSRWQEDNKRLWWYWLFKRPGMMYAGETHDRQEQQRIRRGWHYNKNVTSATYFHVSVLTWHSHSFLALKK